MKTSVYVNDSEEKKTLLKVDSIHFQPDVPVNQDEQEEIDSDPEDIGPIPNYLG